MFKKYFDNSFAESKDLATKVLVDYTLGTPKYGADKSVELTAMDFEKDFYHSFTNCYVLLLYSADNRNSKRGLHSDSNSRG
jgi:hypothetical protein